MVKPKTKEEVLEFAVELEQCAAGLDDIICRSQKAISSLLDDSTPPESRIKQFHDGDIRTLRKCRDYYEKFAKGCRKIVHEMEKRDNPTPSQLSSDV